ncbi:LacI family DNA-binding transcriptional regulator [Thermosipho atlanticus]|uniref:Transcriptional regulator, LacI family n=1 Tax=Thermosipho atlanticus DSM 15807 TaxID=1123380 RepID=A0A1M5TW12_9BACT|nr:LacI family DNA-binding transcriptional regulator [Thermosipho atlanticus]SHH54884.1 transcriptional regulator, LacI family [Thermosipho atlanticus DSM 15807]
MITLFYNFEKRGEIIKRRITIKDIAKELGVNPSTVSRALNDKPGVNLELKKKIKEKAEELGYILSFQAKSLRTKKTMTIGIILSDIKNPFFLDFLDGVEKIFFPRKYKMLLATSNEDLEKEKTYLKWFLEHGVDGIIIAPTIGKNNKNNLNLLRRIKKSGIPVVLYDRKIEEAESEFDTVTINNYHAIVSAIKYLVRDMGHKNLGLCLIEPMVYTLKERYKGFIDGCNLFNVKYKNEWIIVLSNNERENMKRLKAIFDKTGPTAIIATNHYITQQILKAAKRYNRKIPSDLSLIAFDDNIENELYEVPITTIKQPVLLIGKNAATIMMGRLDGEDVIPQNIVLNTELIIRNSVQKL